MRNGPNISAVSALIGDPGRANMLTSLMSGQALTASELAREAGIVAATASGHLKRLLEGGLLAVEKQGGTDITGSQVRRWPRRLRR
jgi:DNA-binding transcriptional ArsR family regulator